MPPRPMWWSRTRPADELVVSLYHTIDAGKLAPHRDEVKALFARNAALRGRAARYIASAAA